MLSFSCCVWKGYSDNGWERIRENHWENKGKLSSKVNFATTIHLFPPSSLPSSRVDGMPSVHAGSSELCCTRAVLEILNWCCPKGSDHPRRRKHLSNRSGTIPVQASQDTRCSGRWFSPSNLFYVMTNNRSQCYTSQRSTSLPESLFLTLERGWAALSRNCKCCSLTRALFLVHWGCNGSF